VWSGLSGVSAVPGGVQGLPGNTTLYSENLILEEVLTHLLLSWLLDPPRRFQSGYDAGDPRVKRMMEALVDIQREDGGWRPFWAEESSPVYTVLAVKALILSGALARKDLEGDVKAYAV
jgi:hypothetical protein